MAAPSNAIRPNRVKALLKQEKVAVGLACFTLDPALVEILGWSGLDFVMIDTEHTPAHVGETLTCIRACEVTGMTALVRVYENSAPLIGKALDNGAQGVVVPHIRTAQDAEAVVRSAKYPPLGDRSYCPSIRAGHFGLLPWKDYCQRANEENLVILLVEDADGIRNIPDILKIKGIDVIFFGPVDFAQSIGLPGETYENPKLYAAISEMVKMCGDAGIPVMTVTSPMLSFPLAKKLVDAGVRMISLGVEAEIFRRGCQEVIKLKESL